ncbi:TetR/AcrR family transcriptional regulator [Tritonibacter scottomollicae]|uniref:TetR/AcrR family transcriptional regulator n=1 Tax=Tritonibacter scottomollicae TaxID=483013 RepID=UPI003AA92552
MQEENKPTPNPERRAQMRARLIAAARALFVEKGYAEASTPEIVRAAGATRGALYHHFDDKRALFHAVVQQEAEAVTQAIQVAGQGAVGEGALTAGSRAFFTAMQIDGRAQLLLVDGPSVLGVQEMDRIDAGGGRAALRLGLAAAQPDLPAGELDARATVLSAAFDRAALAITQGDGAPEDFEAAMAALLGTGFG